MRWLFSLTGLILLSSISFSVFAQEKIITKRRTDTIIIDYHYGKTHISRYFHFLKNHPRYSKLSGHVIFYKNNPATRIWVNHKREIVVIHYGKIRYDCRLRRYKYTICAIFQERLSYWEKRLEIKRRIREAGGKL